MQSHIQLLTLFVCFLGAVTESTAVVVPRALMEQPETAAIIPKETERNLMAQQDVDDTIEMIMLAIEAATMAVELADDALEVLGDNRETIEAILQALGDVIAETIGALHEVGKDFVEGVVNTGKAIWGGITDLFNNGSPPAEVANAQLPSEEQDAERDVRHYAGQ